MRDFGRSDHAGVQAQLDRLAALSLPQGRLGLATIAQMMARLGDPHLSLPPVFHVAGTNGKGSTCAFLRSILEAGGRRVHAAASPHLVRYNERIRIAGDLISDEDLAALLEEVLDASLDLGPSFFEVTIAATFLAFARHPADLCIVEVGLGGRFDATNIIPAPHVCGITALGIDHERFLLAPDQNAPQEPMARIAFEKAGILKIGVPFAHAHYTPEITKIIADRAEIVGAQGPLNWQITPHADGFDFTSERSSYHALPLPALPGPHQMENAGLAIAMLHLSAFVPSESEIRAGLLTVSWPARLQRLGEGPLVNGREIWVDGGHNPNAGAALAKHFAGQKLHLIMGMIGGKNPQALIGPLAENIASLCVVPVPGHEYYAASDFRADARPAGDINAALALVPDDNLPILIAGSLYLAGEVLRINGELPH